MNILIVSYMTPKSPSGVSVHYMNLARSLQREGHQVDTLSVSDAPALIRQVTNAVLKTLSFFGELGNELGRELQNLVRVYAAVRLSVRKKEYDIINAQDLGSAYAAKLASKGCIPVLLTCHFNDDPATENIKRRELTGIAASFTRKWHYHLFKAIEYYNGVSSYVVKRSRHLFNPGAWVEVIHNGIDFQAASLTRALHDLPGQYPGKYILMNIGHLEKRKNQRLLLAVAERMKKKRDDFIFAIVGKGEDQAKLQQQIQKADVTEQVAMLGHHKNVIPLLKSADLYLHTALNENCPLVLLEAIGAGVPVLALAVGGIPELIKQPEALFAPDSSPETIADALSSLLDNAPKRDTIQHHQYADGAKKFNIQAMTQKYLAYYRQIIENFAGKNTAKPHLQNIPAPDKS
jgi:glycogen synthase